MYLLDFEELEHPYICNTKASPIVASGGNMLGCLDGHWVMGTPYKQQLNSIPQTIVYGIYEPSVYDRIAPTKIAINATVSTPAECAALVQRDHRSANAAEYSNDDERWCFAIFDA